MAHRHWYALGTTVLLLACGTSHRDDGEATARSTSALSISTPVAQTGAASPARARSYTRSKKDPDAKNHRTGLRSPTDAEKRRRDAEARTLVEIRPNELALGRMTSSFEPDAAAIAEASMPEETGDVRAEPEGDLVTVKRAAQAPTTSAMAALVTTLLPESVDNSKLAAFPIIRDQDGIGSCTAFAIGYYQYTHELGRVRGWNNKNECNATKVSPRWLYNLANGGWDNGSSQWQIYSILKEQGALMWSDFPYLAEPANPLSYRAWPLGVETWKRALRYAALEYGYLSPLTDPAVWQQVKGMLANGHVLAFGTTVYDWEFDSVDNDPTTRRDDAFVGQAVATWVDGWEGPHGMTLVGYNDQIWVDINGDGVVQPAEKGAFKVANSWGTGWQNAGFSWVAYDAFYATSQVPGGPASDQRHAITEEAAWVTARASYQPDLVGEFTVRTNSRGDLFLAMNREEFDTSQPFDSWSPFAFSSNGGPFRFDGTESTRPQEATFPIDLTAMALSYGDIRYRLAGSAWNSGGATLSRFTLVDALRSGLRTVSTDPPAQLGSGGSQSIRYQFQNPSRVPDLVVSPTFVPFGNVALANTATRPVEFRNQGTGQVVITSQRSDHLLFRTSATAPLYLEPGASATVDLSFAPAASQTERTSLQIRSNDATQPSLSLPLSGTGTSPFGQAPLKVYVIQQSDPNDSSIAMRFSLTSSATRPLRISDYRLVYYLNQPYTDLTGLVWDQSQTTFPTPVAQRLRPVYLARNAGIRSADTALEFSFPSGATINPGQTLILEGRLHHSAMQLTFDESDDWSWYTRRDGLAENVLLKSIGTNQILFGSSPEFASGAYEMAVTPNPTSSTATATFTVTDPALVNQWGWLVLKRDGIELGYYSFQVEATGTQSITLDLPSESYPAGTYALVLHFYYSGALDFVEFQHT